MNAIKEAVDYIQSITNIKPEIGMILGSGLGDLAEEIVDRVVINYGDIPNFPVSKVKGHAGRFVIGRLEDQVVIAMQGRFHYYEGHAMSVIGLPVRVMKYLGVQKLIVTNAAGSVNLDNQPGDLMIITDHINLMGNNPLMGQNDDTLGPRFPDMSNAYHDKLRAIALEAGKTLNIPIKQGVYAAFTGPMYETPAEIRMSRIIGADAVGMSTVPEVIAAAHCGIQVLGISCLTNMAAGILDQPLDHSEVIETSSRVKQDFIQLVKEIIKLINN